MILSVSISGCGVSYHYYAPPVNNNLFANRHETHFSGHTGNTGSSAKYGYAITDKLSLTGTYQVSSPLKYSGSEFETGFMLGKLDSAALGAGKSIGIGCGFGSNNERNPETRIKNFQGNFIKPFAMLTFGSAHKTKSIGNFIFVDGAFSLKLNYLMYRGYKATTINNLPSERTFNTNILFAEPYFNFNLGIKWFRIDLGIGAILKKKYAFDKNLAIFPFEANAGVIFILGRKSIENID